MDTSSIKNSDTQDKVKSSNTRKKIILITILVIIYVMTAIFLVLANRQQDKRNNGDEKTEQSQTQPDESTLMETEESHITFTATGFSPATIKVKPGTMVTWKNLDSRAVKVTSKDNPPLFDSEEALQPNESFSYIFEKQGTYEYTGQGRVVHSAVVIVE